MLTKKHWHDFKVGDVLLWKFYGNTRSVQVVYAGPNYVSIVYCGDENKRPHPVRLWEAELSNLEKIDEQ